MSLKRAIEESNIREVRRLIDAGENVTPELIQLAKKRSEEPEFLNENKAADGRIYDMLRLGPTAPLRGAVTDVMVKHGVPEDVQRHIIEPMVEIGGRRRKRAHTQRRPTRNHKKMHTRMRKLRSQTKRRTKY